MLVGGLAVFCCAQTVWLILKNLAPGAIVILHDGIRDPSRSIEALPDVLAAGTSRGFTFVPVGALMEASGYAPQRAAWRGTFEERALARRHAETEGATR